MKRGCLVGFATWALCALGYWYWVHDRVPPPLNWIVPVVAGFIMAVIVGTLRIAFASAQDAMRLSQSSLPGFAGRPEDGSIVSVTGPIQPSRPPLRAPISGRPAVAYMYEISHVRPELQDEMRVVKDYSGFGLSPATVGSMRLLGFPSLQSFDRESPENAAANAASYIAATEFKDMTGFSPTALYHELRDLLTDDDGSVRKDWRMTKDADLTDADFVEQIVVPGEQVTAIGRYAAQKGGLVPDATHPLQLIRGDASVAAGALWRSMASNAFMALLFAVVVNGAVYGFLRLVQSNHPIVKAMTGLSGEKLVTKIQDLDQAARNGDIPQMERLVKERVPVDGRGPDQSTALMNAADAKTAQWLIAHGADVNAVNADGQTPLMERARAGDAESVKLLIRSGAHIDTVSTKWKVTALQFALDAEKLDVVQVLRAAGAKDDTITEANGHAVTDDSDEVRVCRDYVDAIQHEDVDAMNRASTRGPFTETDFKLWKSVRFTKGRLVSGFSTGDAATVSLRGPTPDGEFVTWTYQVVKKDGTWKVRDERWETRFNGREP